MSREYACGSVQTVATVASFVSATPQCVSITRTAAGTYSLVLSGGGIDAAECSIVCTERGTLAASGMSSFGVAHTSDTVKVITCLREGAAGAASALADMNFDFEIKSTRAGIDPS